MARSGKLTRRTEPAPALTVAGLRLRDRQSLLATTALQGAVLIILAAPAAAQPAPTASPQGGSVVAGHATISQTPTTTTINQSTSRAAVNWKSFDVGSQETVQFHQPASNSVTLNRVVGPDPSQIAGHITANGQVVLTNQSGVVFTQGAQVDVSTLIVSAAGITNQNFMAGRMKFDIPGNPDAKILNAGTITIGQMGLAALVAPQVSNTGLITARLGHVVLAGAKTATVDLYGDGLLSLNVNDQVSTAPIGPDGKPVAVLVTNTGAIAADGGTVQLTARAVDELVQNLVTAGGKLSANTVGDHLGTVVASGIGGSVRVVGNVSAAGQAAGSAGGNIELNASDSVTVASTARVNASGKAGGGTVAVGTTLARAKGGPSVTPTLTAQTTSVAAGARIAANATQQGNGGKVTVLSTQSTAMAGTISARGGTLGGTGGAIELSGAQGFSLTGKADVTAPIGAVGTILIDPTNLTIADQGNAAAAAANQVYTVSTPTFNDGFDAGFISTQTLAGLTGNVVLQASNNITVAFTTAGDNTVTLTTPAASSLTLEAGNNIAVDPGIVFSLAGGSLSLLSNFSFPAVPAPGTGGITLGTSVGTAVTMNAASVTMQAGSGGISFNNALVGNTTTPITTLDISTASTGPVTQLAAGSIVATTLQSTSGVTGAVTLAGSTNSITNLGAFATSGNFSLVNSAGLNITGAVSAGTTAAPNVANTQSITLTVGGTLAITNTLNAGTVNLDASGAITESGAGAVAANTLTGPGPGLTYTTAASAILTGTNNVTNLGTFASTGAFALTDSADLTVNGSLSASGVTLTDPGALSITGTIGAGTVALLAGGAISETGGILATTLSGPGPGLAQTIASSAILTGTNSITNLGTFATTGAFALTDGADLTVNGSLSASGVTLTDPGALSITGTIGAATVALLAGGAITETGGIVATTLTGPGPGLAQTTATSAILTGTNSIANLGTFATTGAFALTDVLGLTVNGSLSASGVTLTDPGALSITGTIGAATVALLAGGVITESGGIVATTLTGPGPGLAQTIASSATLTGTNSITNLGDFFATGSLSLTNSQALTVGGTLSGGSVALTTTAGAISQNGGTTIAATGAVGSVSLTAATGITLGGTIAATGTGASVGLIAQNGSITETLAGSDTGIINATSLTGSASMSVTLDDTATGNGNQIVNLGSFTATGGNFTLIDKTALNVLGSLSAGGILAITTEPQASTGPAAVGAANIVLAASATAPTINITAGLGGTGSISQTGGTLAGTGTSTGVSLTATGGPITQSNDALIQATAASGTVTLTAGTSIAFGGTIAATGSGAQVGLFAQGGGITETNTLDTGIIAATTLIGSATLAGSNVILDNATIGTGNQVATLGAFTTAGNFTLIDSSNLTIAGPLAIGGTLIANAQTPPGGGSSPDIIIDGTETAAYIAHTAAGSVSQTAGTLTATGTLDSLALTAGGSITQSNFALLLDTSPSGTIALTAGTGMALGGTLSATGSIASVMLAAQNGGISQTIGGADSGIIDTTFLTGSAASASAPATASVVLDHSINQVATLGAFSTPSDFILIDGSTLSVVGLISAGGAAAHDTNLALTTPSLTIASAGSLVATSVVTGGTIFPGLITLRADTMALLGSITASDGAVSIDRLSTGTISIDSSLQTGSLDLSLTQSELNNIQTIGTLGGSLGPLSGLGTEALIFGTLSAGNVPAAEVAAIDINTGVSLTAIASTVGLFSSGSIIEAPAGSLAVSNLTALAGAGSISLAGTINTIGTLGNLFGAIGSIVAIVQASPATQFGNIQAGGSIVVLDTDAAGITLRTSVTTPGSIAITNSAGDITVNAGTGSYGISGSAVTLSAPVGNFKQLGAGSTIAATGTVGIFAGGTITQTAGVISAATSNSLSAADDIVQNGSVFGGGSALLSAGHSLYQNGIVSAGTMASLSAIAGDIVQTGSVFAGGTASLSASNNITQTNTGTISAGGSAGLTAGVNILQNGSITVGGNAYLSAGNSIYQNQASVLGQGVIHAGSNATLSAAVDITQDGSIFAGGNASLSAPTINQAQIGLIVAHSNATLLASQSITQNGSIFAGGNAYLSAGQNIYQNSLSVVGGGIVSAVSQATMKAGIDITQNGSVFAGGNVLFSAGQNIYQNRASLTGVGIVSAGSSVTLQAVGTITQNGSIQATSNTYLSAGTAIYQNQFGPTAPGTVSAGIIRTGSNATLSAGTFIDQNGIVSAGGNAALVAGSIEQGHLLSAGGNATLTAGGNIQQYGYVFAGGAANLSAGHSITQYDAAQVSAGAGVSLTAGVDIVQGAYRAGYPGSTSPAKVIAGGNAYLGAGHSIAQYGIVAAGGSATLHAGTYLQQGSIATGGSVVAGGTISASTGVVLVTVGSSFSQTGNSTIATTGSLVSVSAGAGGIAFAGTIAVPGTISLASTSGTITETFGSVASTGVLQGQTLIGSAATAILDNAASPGGNTVVNLGTFATAGNFTLTNQGSLTVVGPVTAGVTLAPAVANIATLALNVSGGDLTIGTTGSLNAGTTALTASGNITEANGTIGANLLTGAAGKSAVLNSTANSITSLGTFSAAGSIVLQDATSLTVNGLVSAQSVSLVSQGGIIQSAGTITATNGTAGSIGLTASGGSIVQDNLAMLAAPDPAGSIVLTASGSIALGGTIAATGSAASLGLIAQGGGISQTNVNADTGIIDATTLKGSATANVAIDDTASGGNSIANLGSFLATAGTLTLVDATGLIVTGTATAPSIVLTITSGGISEASTGFIDATTLSGAATANVTLDNTAGVGNQIGTLGAFSTPGNFTLDDGAGLQINGPLSVGGVQSINTAGNLILDGSDSAPQILLAAGGGILQDAGTLSATGNAVPSLELAAGGGPIVQASGAGLVTSGTSGEILLIAAGSIALSGLVDTTTLTGSATAVNITPSGSGGNQIATLGSFTATGSFTLLDGTALTIAGPLTAGGAETITAPSLTLTGADTAPTLALTASTGAIAQSAGTITGTAAGSSGTPTILLTADGSGISQASGALIVASAPAGTVSLVANNAGSLALGGTISATGTLGSVTLASLGGAVGETVGGSDTGVINTTLLQGPTSGILAASVTLDDQTGNGNHITTLGSFATTGSFILQDATALTITGADTAATFALTANGGGITEAAGATITASGPTGNIALNVPTGTITLGGSLGTASLALNVGAGAVIENSGMVTATLLTGTVGGPVTLDDVGANQIATLGPLSASGAIVIQDAAALTVVGSVSAPSVALTSQQSIAQAGGTTITATASGGAVNLTAGTSIALGGTIAASGTSASLGLIAQGGGISETGGTLQVTTLTGSSANTVTLASATNSIANLGSFTTAAGSFTVVDATGLAITGNNTAPNITLTTTAGSITQNAGVVISSPGAVALTTAGSIALGGTIAAASVALVAQGGGISETNPNDTGIIDATLLTGSASTSITLDDTGGAGNQIANLGSVAAGTGNFTLIDGASVTASGPVSVALVETITTNAGNLIINAADTAQQIVLTAAGSIALGGTLSATGTMALVAQSGGISETGVIAATTLTGSATGPVALADANRIANLGSFTAAGFSFVLDDVPALTLTGPVTASTIALTSNAALTLNTALTASGAGTPSIDLTSLAGGITQAAGSTIAATSPTGSIVLNSTAGPIALGGTISATGSGATVALNTTSGDVSETGIVDASTLTGSVTGAVSLSGGNQIITLGSFTASSAFSLLDVQTQPLTITGPVNASTITLTTINNSIIQSGTIAASAAGTSAAPSVSLTVYTGGITEQSGAVINASNAAGYAALTVASGTIALGGTIAAPSLSLLAGSGGAVTESGSIVASAIGGFVGGPVSLANTAGNQIGDLGAFTATGPFVLNDTASLTLIGSVGAPSVSLASLGAISQGGATSIIANGVGGTVSLTAGTSIALGGTIAATTGNVILVAQNGGITETNPNDTGIIQTALLTGSAAGTVTLDDTAGGGNQIATLGSFSTTNNGAFTLIDGQSLQISGPLSIAGVQTVTTTGAANLTLSATDTAPQIALTAGGSISQTAGTLTATDAASTPSLALTASGGAIVQASGASLVASDTTGSIALTASGSIALGGVISATGGGASVTLVAKGGAISETSTSDTGSIAATLLTGSAGGAVALDDQNAAFNNIGSLGSFSAGGTFTLVNDQNLVLSGPLTTLGAANLATLAGGSIQLNAPITAPTVALNANGAITQAAGTAINATGGPVSLVSVGDTNIGGTLNGSGVSVTATTGSITQLAGSFINVGSFPATLVSTNGNLTMAGNLTIGSNVATLSAGSVLTLAGAVQGNANTVIDATAPTINLNGGTITAGSTLKTGPEVLANYPVASNPGIYFSTTTFNQAAITSFGADTTISINIAPINSPPGSITLNNLQATGSQLFLTLGGGTAKGPVFVQDLYISYTGTTGSSQLTGTVRGESGQTAATNAYITSGSVSAARSSQYRINNCAVGSVNCVVVTPEEVPVTNPVQNILIGTTQAQDDNPDLILPNVAERDY